MKAAKTAGRIVLSAATSILIELMEWQKDHEYMRTHCYAVIGKDVRTERYESERIGRLHELKMRRQAINRLRQQKLIRLRQEGERVVYELTTNGRIKALKKLVQSSDDIFFDDRLCLVSFDIPEASRIARQEFRRFLKSAGFSFLHKSVWTIKKDVRREVLELITALKITRWVSVFITQ